MELPVGNILEREDLWQFAGQVMHLSPEELHLPMLLQSQYLQKFRPVLRGQWEDPLPPLRDPLDRLHLRTFLSLVTPQCGRPYRPLQCA